MTDKRYKKHGMERYRANRWEVVKSLVSWYLPEVYEEAARALACLAVAAAAVFSFLLFI